MRKILIMLVSLIFLACFFSRAGLTTAKAGGESVEEEILDILKEKKVITPSKYKELKKKVEKAKHEKKHDLKAYYKKGFRLETQDKNFKMQIGGRIQSDFRAYSSHSPLDNQFDIRRARIYLAGTVYRDFDYKVQVELEGSSSNRLRDGYLEYTYFKPKLKIRIGQFKEPFSVETLTSSKWTLMQERSLNEPIAPGRDIGIMLHGSPLGKLLTYYVGAFNGDGVDAQGEDNDDKDVAFRFVLSPFAKTNISFLKDFHVAYNMTYGHEDDESLKFKTEARTTFFKFDDADVDSRTRHGVDLAWIIGPLSLRSEWNREKYEDLEGTIQKPGFFRLLGGEAFRDVKVKDNVTIDAWYLAASWFITGEKPNFKKRVWGRPDIKNNFNPRKGTWGAWELGFRYSRFDADKDFWNSGIVSNEYTDEVNAFTLGLNWWLNPAVLVRFNYIHSDFDDKIKIHDEWKDKEDAFTARFQLAF